MKIQYNHKTILTQNEKKEKELEISILSTIMYEYILI